jgi:hypothetical protein
VGIDSGEFFGCDDAKDLNASPSRRLWFPGFCAPDTGIGIPEADLLLFGVLLAPFSKSRGISKFEAGRPRPSVVKLQ